jgi:hypothetical protein
MICMWFTGTNYYKLAVEKDRDSIFTTITIVWKPSLTNQNKVLSNIVYLQLK